jgi:uncharacterized repeat protein (TIGR03803 family)
MKIRIMKSKSTSILTRNNLLPLAFVLGLAVGATPMAQAQTFRIAHSFAGSDGANPLSSLTVAGSSLYGTTSAGGTSGNGVVFEINSSGAFAVLYSFKGGTSDGANPRGSLVIDKAGNLYGTTTAGGAYGAGTVFAVTTKGTEKVLHSFKGAPGAATPEAGLVWHAGRLYGTTTAGGANGNGTVFEVSPAPKKGAPWTSEVIYSFRTGTDGATPVAGVTFAAGKLYGTTSAGGTSGYGTIFELTPSASGWTENILYSFQNGDDGGVPYAGLIGDKVGNFYGGATSGGTGGGGTIFELSPGSSGWTFTVLYNIPGWSISGPFGNLFMDANGNLWGTTHCDGSPGFGTVYELTPASPYWTYTSLYVFTGSTDGNFVYSSPVFQDGSLWGTAQDGGADSEGIVFKIAL